MKHYKVTCLLEGVALCYILPAENQAHAEQLVHTAHPRCSEIVVVLLSTDKPLLWQRCGLHTYTSGAYIIDRICKLWHNDIYVSSHGTSARAKAAAEQHRLDEREKG